MQVDNSYLYEVHSNENTKPTRTPGFAKLVLYCAIHPNMGKKEFPFPRPLFHETNIGRKLYFCSSFHLLFVL